LTALSDSHARRGGATARRWYETVDRLGMDAAGVIRIKFSISGNNNGETEVEVDIGPNDFPTLLEKMCIVDRQAAMAAMSIELSRQIQTQPERDAKTAKAARTQVAELAREKFYAKPSEKDENERIVMTGIEELNKEIDEQ
jgi:hypothetical protein